MKAVLTRNSSFARVYGTRMRTSFPRRLVLLVVTLAAAACGAADPYRGIPADQLFARAQADFEEEDWDDAIDVLERVTLAFPDFERLADARFLLARAYYEDEKYITAHQEFLNFLSRHPASERVPEAALWTCRSVGAQSRISQRDQTETVRAAQVCQNVARDYTGIDDEVAAGAREIFNEMRSRLAKKAFENGEFYTARQQWDSSIIYFEKVVDEFADTDWAPRAIVEIMNAYEEIGYEDEIQRWRERLLNSYPDSPEARAINGRATGEDGSPRMDAGSGASPGDLRRAR